MLAPQLAAWLSNIKNLSGILFYDNLSSSSGLATKPNLTIDGQACSANTYWIRLTETKRQIELDIGNFWRYLVVIDV